MDAIDHLLDIANKIEHTLLRPDATRKDIQQLCDEAIIHGFYAVCVNPIWVGNCISNLSCTAIKVCSVVGFPFGASPSRIKAEEARWAVKQGASEIDMVINIGAIKSREMHKAMQDIRTVRKAVPKAVLKVIVEMGLLDLGEKLDACSAAVEAGADFIKTSTGINCRGAIPEDIQFIREFYPGIKIKAAGKITNYEKACNLLLEGADRLGCSQSVSIMEEYKKLTRNKKRSSVKP